MNVPTSSAKPLAMRNLLMSLAMLSLISAHHVRAAVPAARTTEQIEQTMAQGERAFQHGDLEQAANNWYEAAASYEAQGVRARQVDALILAAEAYQALGQYPAALRIL